MLKLAFRPEIVSTYFVQPRIRSITGTYRSVCTSCPLLLNLVLPFTPILIKRSLPKFPLPGILIVVLFSIPRGILIFSWAVLVCEPVPLQGPQNYLIFLPSPLQAGQDVCMTIIPCLIVLNPLPPHELQLIGWVPALALVPLQEEQTYCFWNWIF